MVDHLVIGHDDMRPVADGKTLISHGVAFFLERIDFLDEDFRIYDNT